MTKIVDQDIPVEFAALYAEIVSANKAAQGASGSVRIRRKSTTAKPRVKAKSAYQRLMEYLTLLAAAIEYKRHIKLPINWVSQRAAEILNYDVPEAYWKPLAPLSTQTALCIPTNSEPAHQPPYGYRDSANKASHVVYPAGAEDSGISEYTGATVDGFFRDGSWKWIKQIYDSAGYDPADPLTWPLMVWDTWIDAYSDVRGSRPMLSLLVKAQVVQSGSTPHAGFPAPAKNAFHFYWRYKLPPADPPYWYVGTGRIIYVPLPISTDDYYTGLDRNLVVCSGVRPLYGHGNNNNTEVDTMVYDAPQLYQIRPSVPVWQRGTDGPAWTGHQCYWDQPNGRMLVMYGAPNDLHPLYWISSSNNSFSASQSWYTANGDGSAYHHQITYTNSGYPNGIIWDENSAPEYHGNGGISDNGGSTTYVDATAYNTITGGHPYSDLGAPQSASSVVASGQIRLMFDSTIAAWRYVHADVYAQREHHVWAYHPSTNTWQSLGYMAEDAIYALTSPLPAASTNTVTDSPSPATGGQSVLTLPNTDIIAYGGNTDGTDATALPQLWVKK